MSLFTPAERAFAEAVSQAAYCNPFTPARISAERLALGDEFISEGASWNVDVQSLGQHANVTRLTERARALVKGCRARLAEGSRAVEAELRLYEDLGLFYLYHHHYPALTTLINQRIAAADHPPATPARNTRVPFYAQFSADVARLFEIPGVKLPSGESAEQLFALFFQLRRAFHYTFTNIVGGSAPAWGLRAAVWESIFTHDLRRYRRIIYRRMGDLTTLITGPSGTGKELVARAIGLSRFVPFDPKSGTFAEDFIDSFNAVSLSALSPTLIESELFGHRRGAFTGALEDRPGWLEVCRPLGTVFLDEIGEIEVPVQVKLLRVLQTRTFQRLGETSERAFSGKVIAATNRDLRGEMEAGRFREDFYYRLCSDMVTTPSLHDLLGGCRREMLSLVEFIARRVVGDPTEARPLVAEVVRWIEQHLGADYRWPGNFRELEQCVRNILVRGAYHPATRSGVESSRTLAGDIERGVLSAEALIGRYCASVYAQTRSYEETARRVGLDRRTVKAKIETTHA